VPACAETPVSFSTSGAMDGPVCMPLAPVPIIATRLAFEFD